MVPKGLDHTLSAIAISLYVCVCVCVCASKWFHLRQFLVSHEQVVLVNSYANVCDSVMDHTHFMRSILVQQTCQNALGSVGMSGGEDGGVRREKPPPPRPVWTVKAAALTANASQRDPIRSGPMLRLWTWRTQRVLFLPPCYVSWFWHQNCEGPGRSSGLQIEVLSCRHLECCFGQKLQAPSQCLKLKPQRLVPVSPPSLCKLSVSGTAPFRRLEDFSKCKMF